VGERRRGTRRRERRGRRIRRGRRDRRSPTIKLPYVAVYSL
jgi:hypothetical protein